MDRKSFSSLAFPAITICQTGWNKWRHFKNYKSIQYRESIGNGLQKFIDFNRTAFKDKPLSPQDFEYFSIQKYFADYMKFNGGVKHQKVTAEETTDNSYVEIINNYTEVTNATDTILYNMY